MLVVKFNCKDWAISDVVNYSELQDGDVFFYPEKAVYTIENGCLYFDFSLLVKTEKGAKKYIDSDFQWASAGVLLVDSFILNSKNFDDGSDFEFLSNLVYSNAVFNGLGDIGSRIVKAAAPFVRQLIE